MAFYGPKINVYLKMYDCNENYYLCNGFEVILEIFLMAFFTNIIMTTKIKTMTCTTWTITTMNSIAITTTFITLVSITTSFIMTISMRLSSDLTNMW